MHDRVNPAQITSKASTTARLDKAAIRHKQAGPTSEIKSLTGLRGLAAIFVVVFHASGDFAGSGPAETFLRHGYNAVDVFFVLSGFVMALTYGQNADLRSISLQKYFSFLGKRLARVYPLYILATVATFIIFAVGLSHLSPVQHPAFSLLANALLIQAWGGDFKHCGARLVDQHRVGRVLIVPCLMHITAVSLHNARGNSNDSSYRPSRICLYSTRSHGAAQFRAHAWSVRLVQCNQFRSASSLHIRVLNWDGGFPLPQYAVRKPCIALFGVGLYLAFLSRQRSSFCGFFCTSNWLSFAFSRAC